MQMFVDVVVIVGSFVAGAFAWTIGEYVLHSSFHWAKGKNLASRAHLDHHATVGWSFDLLITLAWLGIVLIGGVVAWDPAGLMPATVSIPLGAGWTACYFFYEYHHALAHLRGPRNRWERWLRIHHFTHHFAQPMKNQGVLVPWWDSLFGTRVRLDRVKVPRRLAMSWLVDENGMVRPEYRSDYELVGAADSDERSRELDRIRAFRNLEPVV
ncbi:MAG: sterol desaturase family protein [Microthrixaceae bacterium]